MLSAFLNRDIPPRVTDHPAVVELQRQLDAGESAWIELDRRFQRVHRIVRPGPTADSPADATEKEIERAFACYPQMRHKHFEAKHVREKLATRLATAQAEAQQARQAYLLERMAAALEQVVDELDQGFPEKLTDYFRLRADAAAEGLAPATDFPAFCYFDSPLQPGLDSHILALRMIVTQWRTST